MGGPQIPPKNEHKKRKKDWQQKLSVYFLYFSRALFSIKFFSFFSFSRLCLRLLVLIPSLPPSLPLTLPFLPPSLLLCRLLFYCLHGVE